LSELTLGHPAAERLSTRIILVNYPDESGKNHPLGLIAERATEIIRREAKDFAEPGLKLGGAPYLGPVLTDNRGVIQLVREQHLLPDHVRDSLFCEPEEQSR
jgi:chemotaxis-related protein WspB